MNAVNTVIIVGGLVIIGLELKFLYDMVVPDWLAGRKQQAEYDRYARRVKEQGHDRNDDGSFGFFHLRSPGADEPFNLPSMTEGD